MQRSTLGELALWDPPPDEIDYFQRFINVIDEFYPYDWRSWEVNTVSYEDLFGDRISSDEECRLRFAVPTLHLAYAFSDGQSSLSERKYKRIKRQLITWPLGRAIIYSPFATMKKIHPTDAGNRFSEMLSVLKSQLISRSEAAKILQNTSKKFRPPLTSQKRPHSPGLHLAPALPYKKARNEDCDTLTDFLKQQHRMLEKLCKLSEYQNENIRLVRQKMSKKYGHTDIEKSESDDSSEEETWSERSYSQKVHEKPARNLESPTDELVDDSASTVSVETVDETLSVAEDSLVKQGIACQRLGTDGWQNIIYIEGQKKFQATPVFTNLKVNSHLVAVTPPEQLLRVLEKMDLCLGAITYGLLQQRKEFQEIYQKATLEVKSVISKYFLSSESSFRRTTDSLLQYTCGKRAEIIQQRRSIYKPSNKMLYELLHSIPPSTTHLFSDLKLSEIVKAQGGIDTFFPVKYKLEEGRKAVSRETNVRVKPGSSGSLRKNNFKSPKTSTSYTKRQTRSWRVDNI